MNWKIILVIVLLFALIIGGLFLIPKSSQEPVTQNQGPAFPGGTDNYSDNSAKSFAVQFYTWYLEGNVATPGFSQTQKFASEISAWLTPEFAANWFVIAGDAGVDPALQTQDFQPSWAANIAATTLSESTDGAQVLVSLGSTGSLHQTKVDLVRDGTEWRITSIEAAQ